MSTRAAGDALLPNGLEPAQEKCTQENGHTYAQEQECQHLHEEHSQPPLPTVVENLHKQVASFLSEPHDASSMLYRVQNQTRISLNVIQEALKRFSLNELSLSYNGGKDCLVMLILFLSCLHPLPTTESLSKDGKPTPPPTTIPAIYAQPHHPFRSPPFNPSYCFRLLPRPPPANPRYIRRHSPHRSTRRETNAFRPHRPRVAWLYAYPPRNRLALC
ncbi:FAD synthetase [Histoplasma capsulatum]|uniref:FAD synthetase n=1 Tax=Ajellomyces capsulatus TaxID=5037 RepID=A0A8A1LYM1_AJECA|nr:FAD synthetase [Histoplasma capsulatum]